MLLIGGKGSAFTDGAQITTEDKAIVGTGGLVFTSSPTASITASFHHHRAACLSTGKGNAASLAEQPLWRFKTKELWERRD